MSAITVGGDLVHYEVLGRGRPVILVHGWVGSWRYWIPTIQQLHLKYRVYALDLFGFGDSGKNETKYSLGQQINLLSNFMKDLGIPKAAFVGHSLGAMVIAGFAKENPEKAARILLSSVPLFDPGNLDERIPAGERVLLTAANPINTASESGAAAQSSSHEKPTTPNITADARARLETAAAVVETPARANGGKSTVDATLETSPKVAPETPAKPSPETPPTSSFDTPSTKSEEKPQAAPTQKATAGSVSGGKKSPSPAYNNYLQKALGNATLLALLDKCFKRSDDAYGKLKTDVEKTDNQVLHHSITDYDAAVMLDDLRRLSMPLAIVHGTADPVIPEPGENVWNYLTVNNEDTLLPLHFPGVRHFPMLEYEPFVRLVGQFLEIEDISKLEVKERWRRRTR